MFFALACILNQCKIGGLGWLFGILGAPLSNNPFHKGILGVADVHLFQFVETTLTHRKK